ncbi:ACP S-malonyltransferase [Virgisporangium aurantiacum]
MTVAWVFPGQGAQHVGMGADLFDRFPAECAEASAILGYDIREVCLTDSPPGLRDTSVVQPALFVVSALSMLARRAAGPGPDVVAGHSLGEYVALFAAGCFDFGTGVRLVQRRGELMGAASGGGMLAGADVDRIADLLAADGLTGIDVANRNSADQVVLSGPEASLAAAGKAIRAAKAGRCVPLRVSAAFHSRYMSDAADRFAAFLDTVRFEPPRIPVIANVTAAPYPADGIRELLVRQIRCPVRWWESMSRLVHSGVSEVVEVGPGKVLTGLWEAIRTAPAPAPVAAPPRSVSPEVLGSAEFRRDYGVRYAYVAGSMYKGIASVDLVARMGRAGLLGFFGAGGLSLDEVTAALVRLRAEPGLAGRFGMNLIATADDPAAERETVARYLDHDVRYVEAAAYTSVTPGVVRFRFSGAGHDRAGTPRAVRHVLAKVSRPEVAAAFMDPPPAGVLVRLVAEGSLTPDEARAASRLPVAGDVCVEADSGGHTDAGNPYTLMPAITRLRDERMATHRYPTRIRVGAAGGLGSPESVAAAFVLGADFVVTGSVNQCTVEAGTSDAVKDLLAGIDVQDTAYAPAGDMFELGARVQVVRKGTLFAARANKLYQLYRQLDGLDDIDAATRRTIEERYFRRSFDEVWTETERYLRKHRPHEMDLVARSPKAKMARVFRWYFTHSNRVALAGTPDAAVNYQVHCGPALGAFNRVVAGTALADWRSRHPDDIAELLMTGAAAYLDGVARQLSTVGRTEG